MSREFYMQSTLSVAKELVGCLLVVLKTPFQRSDRDEVTFCGEQIKDVGRIVETEAYLGFSDKACHSYKAKPFGRTNIMYKNGGYAYIYLIYGMYHCINVVTEKEGVPEAVLIRALEPLNADEDIRRFSGPGKLCRSMGITRLNYGADFCADGPTDIVIIKSEDYNSGDVIAAKRINIAYSEEAADYPYRFYDKNSASVSKKGK